MNAKQLSKSILTSTFALALASCATAKDEYTKASFPTGIDHSPWNEILQKYVDEKGLVDYKGLKANSEDYDKLNNYLDQYRKTGSKAEGKELAAAATNAYNAYAIRSIIKNYPTESIKDIDDVFTSDAHPVGDQKISLDDIEKGNLVPEYGPLSHSIVVCCAVSCPPLQKEAYTAENIDELAKKATSEWLARKDLNNFEKENDEIHVSKIFKWYEGDFEQKGGVKSFIKTYAPEKFSGKIDKAELEYLDYDWKLNEQK